MELRTRAEWGAIYDVSKRALMTGIPVRFVHVHHSVTLTTINPNADMRDLERIDIQRFGVPSYSWAVHPSGVVLEGMGLHRGAHTINNAGKSLNDVSFGIVFMGNFELDQPTPQALHACRALLGYLDAQKWLAPDWKLDGHRDVFATACPGRNLYAQLPVIRTPLPDPIPEPPENEDMIQTVVADDGTVIVTIVGKDNEVWAIERKPGKEWGKWYSLGGTVRA